MLVALLAEGVDRNILIFSAHYRDGVALLAEGVDRNPAHTLDSTSGSKSPSSRRAWIEIGCTTSAPWRTRQSPSSRRAWIEIFRCRSAPSMPYVALLAEGVDRNRYLMCL